MKTKQKSVTNHGPFVWSTTTTTFTIYLCPRISNGKHVELKLLTSHSFITESTDYETLGWCKTLTEDKRYIHPSLVGLKYIIKICSTHVNSSSGPGDPEVKFQGHVNSLAMVLALKDHVVWWSRMK